MKKKQLLTLLALMPLALMAQTFDFDMTKPQPVYNDAQGYGYDVLPAPDKKNPNAPFYFSVKVPDGNYKVSVTIGSKKKAGETTVRAEGRRLMVHNVATKKGKTETFEFVVNKRSPQIDEKNRVKLKDREKGYLAWDDKLTLEFNGDAPQVQSLHIERDDQVPTIYLCGNSTVVDQNNEPWASWGQMITRWFGPQVAISNHAESGLTARTFIGAGRLDKILTTLKQGDYVVVEFGHNDEKEKRPGDGAWYHYTYQLKVFVDRVRSKGAEIVFCTPTQRRQFNDDGKSIRNTHGDFPAAMRAVAEREKVPVIDLNAMTTQLYIAAGPEESKHMLVHYPKELYGRELADNTHFNPFGAYEVAKCVVMGMKQLQLPIVKFLRPEWQDFDPTKPDDWQAFKWAPSRLQDIVKPDGN
ncbi:MAG: rhamnogalacturonan acetylesterase [Prevotella sp.]|nr:rhamnogalacturonan acetylesterase [Prevotella sp.]